MKSRIRPLCFVLIVLICSALLHAQQKRDPDEQSYSSRTRAVNEADSRAEQEADRLVSLPPEKIILLLQKEPGLFLEVKKLIVRKAFEQGRILDPKEISDDAIFRQLRDDEEIRALITQEIVDRGYVRAKPSREELTREFEEQRRIEKTAERRNRDDQQYSEQYSQESGEPNQANGTTQFGPNQRPNGPQYFPGIPLENNPQTTTPQSPLNNDQSRTLLQTSLGEPTDEEPSGLPFNEATGGQQQISPSQIQQLLSAYSGGQLPSGVNQADLGKLASTMGTNGNPPSAAQQPQSQEERYYQSNQLPQQAKLESNYPHQPQREQRRPQPRVEDQPRLMHQANPYADVPSLYDLYAQYSQKPITLKRFGLDIFENGTGNFDQLPMDLPAGPEYVVGPGDGLNIDLWGSISQRLQRTVDREGRLSLPEIGTIQVAGHTLGDVQRIVQASLRGQFRQLDADVSLARLRMVRVYVVGDVARPGAYDVSSLSTALNALYQAGGPTSRGSLRVIKHYRGNQLVEDVDLYDLLLHGVQGGMQRLESGDTLLIPPIGQEVTIQGMVRRPGIYELDGEKSLAQALELAGGVLPSGTLRHVDVERVQAHEDRTMLSVDIPENNDQASVTAALEQFQVQDGDKIKISPILPFAEKTVYLDGHVFRPGKYAYRDGMKITDLVHSYSDLLPESYQQHAEIIRLSGPDLKPQIIAFNLGDTLQGKDPDLALKPFDTVRVFGRFDFEDPPIITVNGAVRDPGDHVTNGATYLRDAVFLAGNATPDASLNDVQVFRKLPDGKMEVLNADLRKAIAGDEKENMLLQPQDRVFIHNSVQRLDPPTVEVQGEVPRPGKYPLGENMTATELVRLAGGLKRSAYAQLAELTRYDLEQGGQVESEHIPIKLGEALGGEPDTDMRLHAGDVLTVKEIAGWKDIGATVKVDGEVVHPGTFGIQEGERLSDVLSRAGGLRADAYPYGAIFERVEIRELEEKNRAQLVSEAKQEGGGLGAGVDDPLSKDASLAQWRETLQKLETTPPVGRMIIHISSNKSWAHSAADVQLRAGDSIYIPKKPNFVMVQGAVYNQTAITFRPGKSARWYLHQAGGATSAADRKNIFIVRADGTVAGGPKTMFNGGALEAAMQPGDMIMVPSKAFGGGIKWKETLQVAQLVSAVGIAVQVARGF